MKTFAHISCRWPTLAASSKDCTMGSVQETKIPLDRSGMKEWQKPKILLGQRRCYLPRWQVGEGCPTPSPLDPLLPTSRGEPTARVQSSINFRSGIGAGCGTCRHSTGRRGGPPLRCRSCHPPRCRPLSPCHAIVESCLTPSSPREDNRHINVEASRQAHLI